MKCLGRSWSTFKGSNQLTVISASYFQLVFSLPVKQPQIVRSFKQKLPAAVSACSTTVSYTDARDNNPRALSDWSAAPTHKKRGSYSLTWPPTPVTFCRSQPLEQHVSVPLQIQLIDRKLISSPPRTQPHPEQLPACVDSCE